MVFSNEFDDPVHVDDEYDYNGDHHHYNHNTDNERLDKDEEEEEEEKAKIRNKYISNRRGSIAADLDDDDDMREELNRLTMAQNELHKELQLAMQMVEISSRKNNNSNRNSSDNNSSIHEPHWAESVLYEVRAPITRAGSKMEDSSSTSFQVEVEEEADAMRRPRHNKLGGRGGFAKGFFEIVKPKESLESQKRRQLALVQKTLQTMEPGLEDVMTVQQLTQEAMVLRQKDQERAQIERDRKLQALVSKTTNKNSKPLSLEEEKQRQLEILQLTMGDDMASEMKTQQVGQQAMIEKKQQELEQMRVLVEEKLRELNLPVRPATTRRSSQPTWSTNTEAAAAAAAAPDAPAQSPEPQFWSAPRKRLEFIMGRKKKEQDVRTAHTPSAATVTTTSSTTDGPGK
jgi:hypothetical protein